MTDSVAAVLGEEALLAVDRRLSILRMISSFIQTLTASIWIGGKSLFDRVQAAVQIDTK
jgi:hypothetical protein